MTIKNWKKIRDSPNIAWVNPIMDVNVIVFKNEGGKKETYGVEVDKGVGRTKLLTPRFIGSSEGQKSKSQAIGIAKRYMRKHPNG